MILSYNFMLLPLSIINALLISYFVGYYAGLLVFLLQVSISFILSLIMTFFFYKYKNKQSDPEPEPETITFVR